MKDAIEKIKNMTYGVELELSNISQREAVKAVVEATGGTARYVGRHLNDWKITMPDGRQWTVETDASVRNGCETVSPVCTLDDMPMVQEVLRALRRHGAVAHESCGLHVHVGAADMDARQLQNLVKIFYRQEQLIYAAVGTRRARLAHYTRPTDRRFVAAILGQGNPTMESLADAYYQGETRHYHYSPARYRALNLHNIWNGDKHTVEFRLFEATTHAGELRADILLALTMVAKAKAAKAASGLVQRTVETSSGKYDMRVLLLNLGWIGEEFKNPRKHMTKRLGGSAAWKHGSEHGRTAA